MVKQAKITEYELKRLENIKRNDEMLAKFKIRSTLSDLSAAKRQSVETKSYKKSPLKKTKTEGPLVLRRSLRTQGVSPDAATASGIKDDIDGKKQIKKISQLNSFPITRKPSLPQGPIQMRKAYCQNDNSDNKLIDTILRCSLRSQVSNNDTVGCGPRVLDSVDVKSLDLDPKNIARVVPGRIMSLNFFPTLHMKMVVVGNKFGNIGFWNVDARKEDDNGIYVYQPHTAPISGIVLDPFSMSKMYSSCYDGFVRLMDVEKQVFDMVYSSEYSVYSISLGPHDAQSLYISEGKGGVTVWDMRAGKSTLLCNLHENRINTLDFSQRDDNIMATGSTDGTACIWDVRYLNANKPESLQTISHKRAVHSAYFSPSGKILATTSTDDQVGISSGANYGETSMVYHFNRTNRWISTFRGVWGWDDSSIFIGNMRRGVDIINVVAKRTILTLESDLMTAIPCRFVAHPCNVGMLAGATSGGQVYIWTIS